jgi:predicted ATPase/DNA-binding CsgD family transcriptional regulator
VVSRPELSTPDLPTNVSLLHPATNPSHALPPQPTRFLGRELDIAGIQARLRQPEVRLLTLTGPGGAGKTRLALEAAACMADDFLHGVTFVDLVPVRDAALVPAVIAQALDLRDTSAGSPIVALIEALREQRLLLLLDNFEHLIAAAPAAAEIVAACPGVKLLITSRAALRVRWEQEMPVAPLPVPPVRESGVESRVPAGVTPTGSLRDFAAIELFVERAQAVRPGFELTADNAEDVVSICARLEGMPLAIELAAARVRILSPRALLARLTGESGASPLHLLTGGARDLPERQRSLRDTIAWSHDLLSGPEQALFRRLAVFAGGAALEAVEAVCGADALDGLASLVDKNLLRQRSGPDGEPRFGMLEIIHEFALEQLATSDEEQALRRRHAEYLLHLARTGNRALSGPEQGPWVQRLESEHHNLRAALAWALTGGEAETALRLCAALTAFWYIRGHYREGRDWCVRALAVAAGAPAATRAAVLHGAASLADIQHDQADARRLIEASVALWREAGANPRGLAAALALFGMLARHDGDRITARKACEEALAIYAQFPNPWGQRLALGVLGWVAEDEGDHVTAQRFLEESLVAARQGQSPTDVALQLNNLGIVALRQGDDAQAEVRHREALLLTREVGAHEPMACALEGLAGVIAARGRPERAARLLGAASALRAAIGSPRIAQFEEEYARLTPAVQEALGAEAFAAAIAEGRAAPLVEVLVAALTDGTTPESAPVPESASAAARQTGLRVAPPAGLTRRQVDYLRLLALGHTNREIARALVVSETGVEQMLVRVYEKIHARNRAEAIRFAIDHGLTDSPQP